MYRLTLLQSGVPYYLGEVSTRLDVAARQLTIVGGSAMGRSIVGPPLRGEMFIRSLPLVAACTLAIGFVLALSWPSQALASCSTSHCYGTAWWGTASYSYTGDLSQV